MGRRGVSIVDIAQMAGVSKATVSNVLNGTGRVGEATRARVLAIAEREGYVANFAARSLRAAKTKTVGILTPDVSNVFFSSVVMYMERALYNRGYSSFVCDTESDVQREASYLRSMLQKQVDGLVFVNNSRPLDLASLPEGLPVVTVDRAIVGTHERLVDVGNDVRAITHDMTKTLLSHGRKRIALVIISASPVPIELHGRYLGYVEALAEAGVRLDHDLVLHGPHERPSIAEAYDLVAGLVDSSVELDGVVAMGDRVAIGAMQALKSRGLAVGSDVLVIGCDDSPVAQLLTPQLSSVNRNVDQLASEATDALVAMMDGVSPQAKQVVVPHEVIERATTLGVHVADSPNWH